MVSKSYEICTQFVFCCALLQIDIDISHILQDYCITTGATISPVQMKPPKKIRMKRLHESTMNLWYKYNKTTHNKTVSMFYGIYCIYAHRPRNNWLTTIFIGSWVHEVRADECFRSEIPLKN